MSRPHLENVSGKQYKELILNNRQKANHPIRKMGKTPEQEINLNKRMTNAKLAYKEAWHQEAVNYQAIPHSPNKMATVLTVSYANRVQSKKTTDAKENTNWHVTDRQPDSFLNT